MCQLNTRELAISRKKYYNLCRGLGGLPPGNGSQNRALGALELLLQEQGFNYRARYLYTISLETGYTVARSLQQLIFWLPIQENLNRRFIPNFTC